MLGVAARIAARATASTSRNAAVRSSLGAGFVQYRGGQGLPAAPLALAAVLGPVRVSAPVVRSEQRGLALCQAPAASSLLIDVGVTAVRCSLSASTSADCEEEVPARRGKPRIPGPQVSGSLSQSSSWLSPGLAPTSSSSVLTQAPASPTYRVSRLFATAALAADQTPADAASAAAARAKSKEDKLAELALTLDAQGKLPADVARTLTPIAVFMREQRARIVEDGSTNFLTAAWAAYKQAPEELRNDVVARSKAGLPSASRASPASGALAAGGGASAGGVSAAVLAEVAPKAPAKRGRKAAADIAAAVGADGAAPAAARRTRKSGKATAAVSMLGSLRLADQFAVASQAAQASGDVDAVASSDVQAAVVGSMVKARAARSPRASTASGVDATTAAAAATTATAAAASGTTPFTFFVRTRKAEIVARDPSPSASGRPRSAAEIAQRTPQELMTNLRQEWEALAPAHKQAFITQAAQTPKTARAARAAKAITGTAAAAAAAPAAPRKKAFNAYLSYVADRRADIIANHPWTGEGPRPDKAHTLLGVGSSAFLTAIGGEWRDMEPTRKQILTTKYKAEFDADAATNVESA